MNDQIERDEFLQFLGWLTGDLPELHQMEAGRMLESWDRFQIRRKEVGQTSRSDGEESNG